jgi:hypothetical protein
MVQPFVQLANSFKFSGTVEMVRIRTSAEMLYRQQPSISQSGWKNRSMAKYCNMLQKTGSRGIVARRLYSANRSSNSLGYTMTFQFLDVYKSISARKLSGKTNPNLLNSFLKRSIQHEMSGARPVTSGQINFSRRAADPQKLRRALPFSLSTLAAKIRLSTLLDKHRTSKWPDRQLGDRLKRP